MQAFRDSRAGGFWVWRVQGDVAVYWASGAIIRTAAQLLRVRFRVES